MKCFKCKSAERHGSLSYCQPCYNIHVKELRDKKKAKMDEPVKALVKAMDEKVVGFAKSRVDETSRALRIAGIDLDAPSPWIDDIVAKRTPPAKAEPSEPIHAALKNPLYLSYYVRPGTDLHRELIKAEKVYEVEGRI